MPRGSPIPCRRSRATDAHAPRGRTLAPGMPPAPTLLALAPGLGWTLGVLAGVALAVYGGRILRGLARRGVHWWSSVAAPLLLLGPALGVLLGCWLTGHPLSWGMGVAHAPANVAW